MIIPSVPASVRFPVLLTSTVLPLNMSWSEPLIPSPRLAELALLRQSMRSVLASRTIPVEAGLTVGDLKYWLTRPKEAPKNRSPVRENVPLVGGTPRGIATR